MKSLRLTILFAMLVGLVFAGQSMALLQHGLSTTKGTNPSTLQIGDEYCSVFTITNTIDESNDTLVVNSVSDVLHAASGELGSGNIIGAVVWTLNGGATQDSITHEITLPPGASVSNAAHPHCSGHLVTIADYNKNADHRLRDTVTILSNDLCDCACAAPGAPCVEDCAGCDTSGNTDIRNASALIQAPVPCIQVDKSVACNISMPGEEVIYHFKITNCSTNPVETLTINSMTDTILGNLTAQAQAACSTIAANGGFCSFDVPYIVKQADPNPLHNDVNVVGIDLFGQKVSATDDVNVTLIHPDFTVTKTCTSKPIPLGGPATFQVVITNTGDVDLEFTTNEEADSNVTEPFTVAKNGGVKSLTISVLTDGTVDVNDKITVGANIDPCSCLKIPDIEKESNLAICFPFPTIDVNKVASCEAATMGQVITYTITIRNTGDDTLNIVSVGDTVLGDLTATAIAHGCGTLAGGAQCSFTVQHTIQVGDNDPLVNLVTVDFKDSQDQHATDSDTATVDIVHPDFTVTKTCTSNPVPIGGPATFTVVVTNIGDVNLSFTTNETGQSSLAEPFTVVKNGAFTTFTITIPADGTKGVTNTITVTADLIDEPECVQFTTNNVKSASDTCPPTFVGITRTWGFWAQHCDFTKRVFICSHADVNLGWVNIAWDASGTNLPKLYGVFRAHDDKKGCNVGIDANDVCKARIQASVQALAAILTSRLSNGASLPISEDAIADTLKGCDIQAINDLGGFLGDFNESNDTGTALDCNGKAQGKAVGGCAKTLGTACSFLKTKCATCN